MVIAGIDYSMNSPAMCIHAGNTWSIDNCKFYYIAKKEKNIIENSQLNGSLYPEWETQIERFVNLSDWSIEILANNNVQSVFIEGYSYGSSSSRLFQIAENTSLLKYQLWKKDLPYDVYPPTMIKKLGTGKGNANKEKMWESFKEETNLNLFHLLGLEEGKSWNPVSDMVDAYYITKLGFTNLNG
jgi:Holliday junction resolvasome RuvABC endonuclease subunit